MAEFPFQLSINPLAADRQIESVTCTALLREIPGRRQIYDGLWNEEPVITKVFSHKISAGRHLRREWRGLRQLNQRQLSSAEPLFRGKTQDGQRAVVVRKIENSTTALELYLAAPDHKERMALLFLVCRELAEHHDKGVLQKDLHLGNFLIADGRVFALDVGQMRFLSGPVTKSTALSQLALLARYLRAGDKQSAHELCCEYATARKMDLTAKDETSFQKKLIAYKKATINRGLKKFLGAGKRCVQIKTDDCLAVFATDFASRKEHADFVSQIDSLMDAGGILKNGNTCYVSRINWNGRDIVIKRYNHKSFIHSLRHTIKRSRARRGWLHGHRLAMLKIATPKPLAYIENRNGMLVWQSYLVTEFVEGQKLYDFLRSKTTTDQQQTTTIDAINRILSTLAEYRITHGDMKHTNILITEDGPVLTDLDAMKVHRLRLTFQNQRRADLARLQNGMPGHLG